MGGREGGEDAPEAFVMDSEGEALLNQPKERLSLHLRRLPRIGGKRITREGVGLLLLLKQGLAIPVLLPSLLRSFLFGGGRRRGGGEVIGMGGSLLIPFRCCCCRLEAKEARGEEGVVEGEVEAAGFTAAAAAAAAAVVAAAAAASVSPSW